MKSFERNIFSAFKTLFSCFRGSSLGVFGKATKSQCFRIKWAFCHIVGLFFSIQYVFEIIYVELNIIHLSVLQLLRIATHRRASVVLWLTISSLQGERPRDRFPPAPKGFMTYILWRHLIKDTVFSCNLRCWLIFLHGCSRTYRVASLRAGPVGRISFI